ncbi:TetR/AcrR family transcriptional regulator C-terminal domain-containing protein [Kitasatospora sp. NPDC059327]|uniref:TetR/AcrR family transcriptional regulator C-terminal domain-containing protein n=1 Tax=Kitasatospora sp. NPDC059327 TaxID=3346803 RepID=UPI003690726F
MISQVHRSAGSIRVAELRGGPDPAAPATQSGDLGAGLSAIGRQYADLIGRPAMAARFRVVIAELPRLPGTGTGSVRAGQTALLHLCPALPASRARRGHRGGT